jgi:hypothetical protein
MCENYTLISWHFKLFYFSFISFFSSEINFSGVFTVPKEAVYIFYLAFGACYEPYKLWMHIVVDSQGKVAGVADTLSAGHDAQGTNFIVLHLHKGDSVWVTTFVYGDVKIYGSLGFTSFSGVLLYE